MPYVPLSHPFIERLIGITRHEFLDHTLFWNARDLERKLYKFTDYHSHHRVHKSLGGKTPAEASGEALLLRANVKRFSWQAHCRGLFELLMAA